MKEKANLLYALAVIVLAFLIQFRAVGYEKTWQTWQVSPLTPHFNDTRSILVWADVYGSGIDPMTYDPPNPSIQSMNYPRIWQYIHHLGLGEKDTTAAGIVVIALFLAGLWIGLPRLDNTGVGFIIAALVSPAVLLGIERANIDLLIFFLFALAIAWTNKRVLLAWAVVLLAFELKLYPIFGLGVLLRKRALIFFALMAAALAYVLFSAMCNIEELRLIAATTPRSIFASFGVRILSQAMTPYGPMAAKAAQFFSYSLIAAATLLSLWSLSRSKPGFLNETDSDPRRLDAFRMGSVIFIGTFLIGNNWDYRLVFLIFTIPQLLDWRRHSSRRVSRIALWTLIVSYIALWYFAISHLASHVTHSEKIAFFLDQACHYALFCGLLYLFVLSLPEYAGEFARRVRAPGQRNAMTKEIGHE